jgi:hypothetical protein
MAQFCKDYVLAMEVCAEGAHVDLGVLPSLLKCRSHIVILARESTTEITILNTELSTFDVDSSSELGDIHLLFRPGHYDLLYPLSVLEPDDFSVPVTASPEQASAAQVSSLESLQPHNATLLKSILRLLERIVSPRPQVIVFQQLEMPESRRKIQRIPSCRRQRMQFHPQSLWEQELFHKQTSWQNQFL